MSDSFKEFNWGELLNIVDNRINMSDDIVYPLASIRRKNGGFFHREKKIGKDILTKNLSKAVPNAFAISRMQIVHGACSYVPESFLGTFLSGSYTQFQPKNPPYIDIKYLHYYCHSHESYNTFLKSSHGVHIEKMTFDLKDWLKQKVSLPPFQEQKKIASILTSIDDVIEKTELQINKLQNLKNASMKELFSKGIDHTEFKDSVLGKIPKSWNIVPLKELVYVDSESLKSSTNLNYSFKYIDISCVSTGKVNVPLNKIIFKNAPSRARKIVRQNDVLISTVRPNLKAFAHFDQDGENWVASTGFAVLRKKDNCDSRFIYNYMLSDNVTWQINMLIVGSNYPAINTSEIRELTVVAPSLPEQKEISSILTSIDTNISKKISKLNQTQSLKKSLMQVLLTGKVRVKVN